MSHDYDAVPFDTRKPLRTRDASTEAIEGGYAPPPSDGPQGETYRMDVGRIASAAQSIERMADPDDALKAHGCQLTMADLQAMVSETTDPYWAWALNILTMASSVARTNVAQGIWDIATDLEHKDRMKALALYAQSHVAGFKKTSAVEVKTSGTVEVKHLTERANNLLLAGDLSVPELSRRLHDRDDIIDATFEEVGEGEEPELVELETGQAVHSAFRVKR